MPTPNEPIPSFLVTSERSEARARREALRLKCIRLITDHDDLAALAALDAYADALDAELKLYR